MNPNAFFNSDDEKYFKLFVLGDKRGLRYFHKELYQTLFIYAYYTIKNEFVSDIIIQDMFLLAWQRRGKMEDAGDLRAFIRKGVSWACIIYLQSRARNMMISDLTVDPNGNITSDPARENEKNAVDQEMLRLIEETIPYLSMDEKIIMDLYKRGLSYNEISRIVGRSYQGIVREIKESIDTLKNITNRIKRAAGVLFGKRAVARIDYTIYLDAVQIKILELYYIEKMSIGEIAVKLKMSPRTVAKIYLDAERIIAYIKAAERRRGKK